MKRQISKSTCFQRIEAYLHNIHRYSLSNYPRSSIQLQTRAKTGSPVKGPGAQPQSGINTIALWTIRNPCFFLYSSRSMLSVECSSCIPPVIVTAAGARRGYPRSKCLSKSVRGRNTRKCSHLSPALLQGEIFNVHCLPAIVLLSPVELERRRKSFLLLERR